MPYQLTGNKTEQTIRIALSDGSLEGNLTLPESAQAVVLFAHGSGSSRFSPRNRFVADVLHDAGLATLLVDLLTHKEERVDVTTAHFRFDIPLLAARLIKTTDWLAESPTTRDLRVGYFGASTGAAAALVAAAGRPAIWAVVSRGGRPDLAGDALEDVRAAVLLIVGGHDLPVLDLNEEAYEKLVKAREKRIEIVPRATHLFEEPGALEAVARLAADWFTQHLSGTATNQLG
ncbi:MAG: dienelactone hydrolase family protein [Pirellulales bacterium]